MARYPDAKYGKTKTVAYAYVGTYNDGTLGWMMPKFLAAQKDRVDMDNVREARLDPDTFRPAEFVLCRITVEAIPGKRKAHVK